MKKECIDRNCVHCVRDREKVSNPLFAMYSCNEKRADPEADPDHCKHFKESEDFETWDQSKNKRIGLCDSCINNDGLRKLCVCPTTTPLMRIRKGVTVECNGYDPVDKPVKKEMVNHPQHYAGKIEVIDYIRDKLTPEGFTEYCCGNVLKYVSRWRKKDGVQDLKKAKVYLEWMIESAEKEAYLNETKVCKP